MISTELHPGTYARLVDVRRALEARTYAADLDVVIGVRDRMLPQNDGAVRLQAGPEGASTARARRRPDLTLDVRDLGAIYLGNGALGSLHAAGSGRGADRRLSRGGHRRLHLAARTVPPDLLLDDIPRSRRAARTWTWRP